MSDNQNETSAGNTPGGFDRMSVARRVVLAFVAVFVANGVFGGDNRASGFVVIGGVLLAILLIGLARWVRAHRT